MKKISGLVITLLFLIVLTCCNSTGTSKKETIASNDTVTVPDTGYTGITKYLSKYILIKEVSFKYGV